MFLYWANAGIVLLNKHLQNIRLWGSGECSVKAQGPAGA